MLSVDRKPKPLIMTDVVLPDRFWVFSLWNCMALLGYFYTDRTCSLRRCLLITSVFLGEPDLLRLH